jgi:PAS domain S-box-containing protein
MATGDGLYFTMALPVRQVSVDDAHPVATNRYAGTLVFIVDAVKFAERVAGNIRSGRSGYGWIMDNKGIFLYHMERDFIGKSAFEARSEKKPNISFSRINELQKEMLLTGKEGMSWYVSGWHRGREGEEIKKLIAYAPVRLLEGSDQHRWSVGVVAPVEEVDGALNRIQVRQVLLQGVSVVVVLLSGLFLMMLMFRWSSSLQRQVEDKTRELSRSESYLRSLIEGADDIIFTVDTAGAISSMNSYGRRFFGLGRGQLAGKMLSDLMPCGVSEKQQSIIRTVFEQGTREQATCSLVAGGSERWLSINYTGIGNDEGQVIAALGIARDITERKQIEQQMTHTEKLASIGTLAAGVAHEINNPLAIILGFTELLREQAEPGTETDEMLQTIERHGLNAKRIVENLLNFSRTSERKSDAVDLNASIETVLGVVGNTMALQQITLEKRLAPDLPKLQGESGELQQVFFNIVTNAISAMETGGVLTVTTECAGDADIRICLSDTGPGIPRDIRPKIFDPFFTTKKVGEGTGLGLSISYGIIKRYGGDIVFETKTAEEAPQSGTSFIITLPIHHE